VECEFLVSKLDAVAVLMVDMPRTAKIRLTVHIYKSRSLRVGNYNGCKIYFNSFLAQSQGFFAAGKRHSRNGWARGQAGAL
jgi:hypothetical protein